MVSKSSSLGQRQVTPSALTKESAFVAGDDDDDDDEDEDQMIRRHVQDQLATHGINLDG